MITSGVAGRPTGAVAINPRAPFADKLVGAFLFNQWGCAQDFTGRNSTALGTAVAVPSPFGLGVQTLSGAGFVTANPPPYVASFAVGGYLPESNATGLVIGAGNDVWSMNSFNWATFVNLGLWRFGVGGGGSVGSGTPAPIGPFAVGMSKDVSAATPTARCYVDGALSVTGTPSTGRDASYQLRSTVTTQTPSKAILDYLLMFSVPLPAWAFAAIRANPYQYFQSPSRSAWHVGSSSPPSPVLFRRSVLGRRSA